MPDRRRAFWPVVLLGVAGAGLGAYAGDSAVTALSLAVLAGWGVFLVLRRTARRVMGVAIAALCVATLRFVGPAIGAGYAWGWASAAGLMISCGAAVLAFLWAPQWPEMGRKYDAPTASVALDADDNTGLWRELSEGRDPTDGPSA